MLSDAKTQMCNILSLCPVSFGPAAPLTQKSCPYNNKKIYTWRHLSHFQPLRCHQKYLPWFKLVTFQQ